MVGVGWLATVFRCVGGYQDVAVQWSTRKQAGGHMEWSRDALEETTVTAGREKVDEASRGSALEGRSIRPLVDARASISRGRAPANPQGQGRTVKRKRRWLGEWLALVGGCGTRILAAALAR